MILWIVSLLLLTVPAAAASVLIVPNRGQTPLRIAVAGVMLYLHSAGITALFTIFSVPIAARSLWIGFAILAALLTLAALIVQRRRFFAQAATQLNRELIAIGVAVAVALFPFTYLPGIDSYRWQDLASSIRMEGRIEWLLNGWSLFGFGPGRSYPIAHPTTLATLQILTGGSIDATGYALSALTAFAVVAAAYSLARRAGIGAETALLGAALYVGSPLFVRYAHWITGRGVFLAFAPLAFLLPFRLVPPHIRALSVLTCFLAHKTAVVAAPLFALCAIPPLTLALRLRVVRLLLLVASAGIAFFLASGSPSLAPFRLLSRFGLFLFAGLWCVWIEPRSPADRQALCMAYFGIALGTTPDMYSAMAALPAFLPCAWRVMETISVRSPRARALVYAAVVATALPPLVVRWIEATPPGIRLIAAFIEQRDPTGPFMLDVRGGRHTQRVRRQLQAYVSGCPRFVFMESAEREVSLHSPPAWPSTLAEWQALPGKTATWLRNVISIEGVDVEHYGASPRRHIVVLEGGAVPDRPPDFETDGIRVFLDQELSP